MKKLFLLLAPLTLGLMVGCSSDDSTILDKIAEMEREHDEMQAQIDAQQKLLDALANKLTITDVIQTSNGYTITLSDGTSMTIKDGEPGDNFIESIVVGEEDVTFTLTDGTVIVIPLGRSSSGSGDTYAENNKIYYTTSDNTKLFPITDASLYGAILISNTYKDGQGVLVFDDAVTKIGGDAFGWCESLTSVTIPDSVTTIGEGAFRDCSNLTSVTIPESVTTIGYAAFANCEKLNTVYCKAINPPTTIVDNNGYWFGFAKEDESGNICNIGCTIYVPTESVEAYKSAQGWSDYASDIVGYNF